MTYVLDTSSIIVLGHYFPSRFPSFWARFDHFVSSGSIISVREVRKELENETTKQHLRDWVKQNSSIFLLPQPEETTFVSEIFSNQHFQALVSRRNLLRGMPVADPFLVASAKIRNGCVVTQEIKKPNAAKIPNVCEHYGVGCTDLEGLMQREGWVF